MSKEKYKNNDPLSNKKSESLESRGKINGLEAWFLGGLGYAHSVISGDMVKKADIQVTKAPNFYQVESVDGKIIHSHQTVSKCRFFKKRWNSWCI